MTKNFKLLANSVIWLLANGVKYSLSVIFLSMVLALMPIGADFKMANQAKAAGWWNTVNQGGLNSNSIAPAYGQSNTPADIRLIAAKIIKVILGFLGIVAVIIILLGGFKWMTAGGSEDKVGEAKKLITAGIIGLIIIIASFAIATFVLTQLMTATGAS